jgi:hypothetical protein
MKLTARPTLLPVVCTNAAMYAHPSDHGKNSFLHLRLSDGGPVWAAQGRGPVRMCVQCVTYNQALFPKRLRLIVVSRAKYQFRQVNLQTIQK